MKARAVSSRQHETRALAPAEDPREDWGSERSRPKKRRRRIAESNRDRAARRGERGKRQAVTQRGGVA